MTNEENERAQLSRSYSTAVPGLLPSLRAVSQGAGAIVILIGCLILLGWAQNVEALKPMLPGPVAVNPTTAVAFILAGISLLVLLYERADWRLRYIAQVCALIVALVGLLKLVEVMFGLGIGVDRLLFPEKLAIGYQPPNRMAPNTALNLLLVGGALLLLGSRTRHWPAQVLALAAALASSLPLVGYAYGVESFYPGTISYVPMALPTALTFVVLVVGILCARPGRGLMAILTSNSMGGTIARRLLPAAILIPVALGWLRLEGEAAGLYDTELGVALFAVESMVVFATLVGWNARLLHRIDTERKRAEAELQVLNQTLEERIAERTAKLEVAVTGLKNKELMLRESEERFRSLIQNASDIITVLDSEGTILYQSPAAERVLGYPFEDRIGTNAFEYLHPDDSQRASSMFAGVLKTPGDYRVVEFRVPHADGSWRHLENTVCNLLDDPSVRGVVINSRDITERKRAEETRLQLAIIVESSQDAIIGKTLDGIITSWNRGAQNIYGYSAEEVVGKPISILAPPERPNEIPFILERIRRGEPIEHYETVRVKKDGGRIDVSITVSPIRDTSGNILGASTIARDITEQKRAEERLRQNFEALLTLYEASQILVSSLDPREIWSRLLELVRRSVELPAAIISLRDEHGELRVWHAVGSEEVWRSARATFGARRARQAATRTKQPQSFRLRSEGSRTLPPVGLCLPLRVRDRLIGVLEAYGSGALLEHTTVDMLSSLASQAGGALENARLYSALGEREKRLGELVGKLIAAQEEERRRVAYEVHDGVAQVAAATHQHLQAFADKHPPGSKVRPGELDRTLELARWTVREARRIIEGLRPTALDDHGLATAVQLLIKELEDDGWEVSYKEALGEERLPDEVEMALYRVVQEALTNVQKHARTNRAHVTLARLPGKVRLEVKDEGRGFDPSAVSKADSGPGERVGLQSMRERIALFGGELKITSKSGVGTALVAEVPLAASEGTDIEDAG